MVDEEGKSERGFEMRRLRIGERNEVIDVEAGRTLGHVSRLPSGDWVSSGTGLAVFEHPWDAAAALAAAGTCRGGCTLWRCGRAAGHPGPCQPAGGAAS